MPMYLIDSEDGPFVLLADEDYINDYYPDAQLLDAYEAEAYEEPEHVQVITRRQGLLAIYRQKHVTEENIQAIIDQMIGTCKRRQIVICPSRGQRRGISAPGWRHGENAKKKQKCLQTKALKITVAPCSIDERRYENQRVQKTA
ncbi:MAG: hypothetical protein Q4A98_00775 [Comamonadaceae bacterium]|nr:hypothetical protein [Comamonadaceae bacterium]